MLRTRSVGLLMDVLSCKLKDDIPNRLAALKLLIHDCQGQSNKTAVDEDMEIGVTFHLRQRQDHDLGTDAGGDPRCHEDPAVHLREVGTDADRSHSERKGER